MVDNQFDQNKSDDLQEANYLVAKNQELLLGMANIYDIDFGMLEKYTENVNSLRTNLTFLEQEAINNILSIYVYGQRPVEIVSMITKHLKNISDEQSRARIALWVAIKDWRRLSEYFDLFWIEDEITKINIGIACAFTHARRLSKHIKSFNIKNEKDRYQLAVFASFNDGPNVLEYFDNYEIHNEKYKKKILATSLLNNPSSVSFAHKLLNGSVRQLKNTESIEEILKRLKDAWEKNPNIIPAATETIYNDMQRKDAWIRLLAGYMLWENVQSPAESLSVLTGVPLFSSKKLNLGNSFWDFLETILDLQAKYFEPFLSKISMDKNVFQDYKYFKWFVEFVNSFNLLTQIQWSQSYFNYKSFIEKLYEKFTTNKNTPTINIENIKDVSNFIQDKFLKEIWKKTTWLWLNYEKIMALKNLWWDITPFCNTNCQI
jgi:hypothetical protein